MGSVSTSARASGGRAKARELGLQSGHAVVAYTVKTSANPKRRTTGDERNRRIILVIEVILVVLVDLTAADRIPVLRKLDTAGRHTHKEQERQFPGIHPVDYLHTAKLDFDSHFQVV